ncbi:hypothetical protein C7I84_16705 [Mesorhizobium ephedrae]|uniref:HTH lysR-type domain-containing protein n=1 Tax=Kumtagia ephedrae TaxID=2116701 RepID=A0A2P7S6K4_9HYPH|nr:LysR family transcriptional regulator [Mesorhizobium ephedrae]PSJ58102.1 hypothetical protein C7I84_16705 [Mesorhizobium ephedrae]
MKRTYLAQLAVLAAVARYGSFRGAARELGVAPSAVSHAVASLEDGLGVRLLARSTRSVAPTEAGAQLLERHRLRLRGLCPPAARRRQVVRVLEDWCPWFDGFHVYYPSRRQMRPALRAFVDFFRHRGEPRGGAQG